MLYCPLTLQHPRGVMVYLQRLKMKKVVVAQLHEQDSDQPKFARVYIEYVEVSTDEVAANGSLRRRVRSRKRLLGAYDRFLECPPGLVLTVVWLIGVSLVVPVLLAVPWVLLNWVVWGEGYLSR